MMRIALTILAALSLSLPAAAQALHPGLWEMKMHLTKAVMFGQAAPNLQKMNERKPDRQCVSAEDAYLQKLVEKIGESCKLLKDDLTGGNLHLRASCESTAKAGSNHPPTSLVVVLDGPYTPEAIKFQVSVVGSVGGTPMDVAGDIDAHRVSLCPIAKTPPDSGE